MTCTTADCFKLDVSLLKLLQRDGAAGVKLTWTWYGQKHKLGTFLASREGRSCVAYLWVDEPLATSPKAYPAYFECLATNVGGSRLFWRCRCGRLVTALYLPRVNFVHHKQEYFLCRHCYRGGLRYGSQYESKTDRLWRRYDTLKNEIFDPDTPLRRHDQLTKEWDRMWPALDTHMEESMLRFVNHVNRHSHESRPRGRPSKRKERERQRAVRAEEKAGRPKRPPGRPKETRAYRRRTPLELSERTNDMQAYCPKCRDRRDMAKGKPATFSNGRPAIQGECAVCGTRMARIVKRESAV